MPQQKRRETSYFLNKGVNEKASKYTIDDSQMTSLFNMDFNIPNALNKRPGSTNMVTANTSGPINSLFEFERLGGASYFMAGTDTAMFNMIGGSFSPISTGYANGQAFDILAFADKAWFTNGETFLSWDGSSTLQQSVRAPSVSFNYSSAAGSNAIGIFGYSNAITFNIVALKTTYLRTDGLESNPILANIFALGKNFGTNTGMDNRLAGYSIPPNVSFMNYYLAVNLSPLGLGGADQTLQNILVSGDSFVETLIGDIPNSVFRFVTSIPVGVTSANIQFTDFNFGDLVYTKPAPPEYNLDFSASYIPRYIEIGQNRLFMAGFSTAPSVVFFSEIGDPDIVKAESFFEVRTNDKDRITAIKSYRDEVVCFKLNSFHKLVGDSSDNYSLVELSTEYGCLSNKAVAEYNNRLLFLDEKGVVEYNGANWDIISHAVEDTFRRINLSAAIDKAVAIHHDFRNQVWFGIPVDGSTVNNLTVVYDYLLNSWTFFDGFQPASFAMAKRELTQDKLWFGDYSGNISHFSPSFYSDNGTGITCLIKTPFDAPDGQNVQNNFRRFFLDVEPASGITGAVNVNVYRNYNFSTINATFSIYQNQFQTRKDFGVAGKSVAFQMSHNSPSLPLTIYGYSVQRRFLRDV